MNVSKSYVIAKVTVMNIGRIVTILYEQRRISVGPGLQPKFLISTIDTIFSRSNSCSICQQDWPQTAGTIIDSKSISNASQLLLLFQNLKCLLVKSLQFPMHDNGEFSVPSHGFTLTHIVRNFEIHNQRIEISFNQLKSIRP